MASRISAVASDRLGEDAKPTVRKGPRRNESPIPCRWQQVRVSVEVFVVVVRWLLGIDGQREALPHEGPDPARVRPLLCEPMSTGTSVVPLHPSDAPRLMRRGTGRGGSQVLSLHCRWLPASHVLASTRSGGES